MRTATGLHVYTYGHSIIARLDILAQSEPGQPGEMTHGSQHPC